ncbi:CHAT domain-containing protein [Acrocarpospora sp. B8E8]|uniref:CHAT domain-containing protein n=1 Tax=Acrocarpospora sp. B8E8 TaxID=3153572 RepID=UPI00325C8CFA
MRRFAAQRPQQILDPKIDLEMADLLAALPADEIEDRLKAGWFYWCRLAVLPEDRRQEDLQAAAAVLAPVFQMCPERIPQFIADFFSQTTQATYDAPVQAHDHAMALLPIARRTGSGALLTRCVTMLEDAVGRAPRDEPDLPEMTSNLGMALYTRYGEDGREEDLARSVEAARSALELTAPNSPNLPLRWSVLGVALCESAKRTGDAAALEEAVQAGHTAAELARFHPRRASVLMNLTSALLVSYEAGSRRAELEHALTLAEEAVELDSAAGREDPGRIANLALAMRHRFKLTDQQDDLDRAVELARRSAQLTAGPDMLANLGSILRTRYARTHRPEDIVEAVEAGQAAVAGTPAHHPDLSVRLSQLSLSFGQFAGLVESDSLLDESVDLARQAVDVLPIDHPEEAAREAILGVALQARYGRRGGFQDIDHAISLFRHALTRMAESDLNRPTCTANLGAALLIRFEATGELRDLNEAIELDQTAIAATPAGHPERPGRLSNLGLALTERHDQTGHGDDLTAAATAIRSAVNEISEDHPERAGYLANLAGALRGVAERTRLRTDIDEVVDIARAAVRHGGSAGPVALANLSAALVMRYSFTGDQDSLDAAVDGLRQAVAAEPHGSPAHSLYLTNHAGLLLLRWDRPAGPKPDRQDLDEALDAARRSVAATSDALPDRARRLIHLGIALHRAATSAEHLAEAQNTLREAANSWSATPRIRIRAAAEWADAAVTAENMKSAHEALSLAVNLLGRLTPRRLNRSDQEFELSHLPGLASDAAACALRAAGPEAALTVLEQGRGVLLQQALETRTDLTSLAAHAPEMAERFERLCVMLDARPENAGPPIGPDQARIHPSGRQALAMELEDLVERIRADPRFTRFLLPPRGRELLVAARDGPVVLVNVSRYGCDALILTTSGVESVPLPGVTPDIVHEQAVGFVEALEEIQNREHTRTRAECESALSTTLAWLWDAIAGPVFDHLGSGRGPAPTRIWWCPTGLLSLLPLHAAGHYGDTGVEGGRSALNRAVSSYTATVRALLHTRDRRRRTREHSPPHGLAVSMPRTPQERDLPAAHKEVAVFNRAMSGRVTTLTGEDALRATVLAAVSKHPWAHFACHAHIDLDDPSMSRLLVHDHLLAPLTVADLYRLRLDEAELAFLSACGTARGAPGLADEAIHVMSGFQLAGYDHVIGTLWPVPDRISLRVASYLYESLERSAYDVDMCATALHEAVVRLSRAWPDHPSMWAAHLHTGR